MPRWLAEDPAVVYAILGVLALVALLIGWMNRGRPVPLGAAQGRKEPRSIDALVLAGLIVIFLALLAGGVFLIERLIVTDQEQIVETVREMAEGVKAHDTERVFRHVSDSYQGSPGLNKAGFKEYARPFIEKGGVTEVSVWEFRFEEGGAPSPGTATVLFYAKASGGLASNQYLYYLIEAKFQRDPDNKWRMKSFTPKNPAAPVETLPLPN